jgi:exocyst complex component 3
MPPGRPKNWKAKALKVMEESVLERIEGNQVLNRDENKMWIVVNLEMLRKMLIDDLKVVRTLCVPVFPPSYDIVKTFTRIYHQGLSHRVSEN